MVESLLIYGVASLAAGAARNLTDLDDDYGLSHIAGHAAFEAVAGGVKRLRERFEQFTPDRNHDLMQALERGYLQALLHLVLPWAESLGINPRELLRTGRVPRWAIDAWETLSGGRPESLMGMAAAPDVRKLVDEILERLGEEPEVSDATREELEQAFDTRVEECAAGAAARRRCRCRYPGGAHSPNAGGHRRVLERGASGEPGGARRRAGIRIFPELLLYFPGYCRK